MKIELNLSEKDEHNLKYKAAYCGLTVSELLSAFVHDLICGEHTNGSDERMYANYWYDRCGFSNFYPGSFYQWLAQNYELEDALAGWAVLKEAQEDMTLDDDPKYRQELQEVIDEHSGYIQELYLKYGGTDDWKQEIADVQKKWIEQ